MTDLHAQSPADLVPREVMLSMSGLEFLRRMVAGRYPQPPIGRTLNFSMAEVEDGRAMFRGAPLFEHANPMGTTHGGWYGAILDSVLSCAAMSKVPQGSWSTTLEYKINVTRALLAGTEVEARAEVVHAGRSTIVAEGRVTGVADGRVYATGSTTCIVISA